MAPVQLSDYDTLPILLAAGYTALLNISLFFVVASLGRAYQALPVAHRTRFQSWHRRKDIVIFAAFALLSLVLNLYHTIDEVFSSYQLWAVEHRLVLPQDVWTTPLWIPIDGRSSTLQLGSWLRDTEWFRNSYAMLPFRNRDIWWMQQKSWTLVIWSIFLAIQGRRRNVPHTWAYQLLSLLTGLSPAQNLFNIAMILTPEPVPPSSKAPTHVSRARSSSHASRSWLRRGLSRVYTLLLRPSEPKPSTWTPHPLFHIITLLFTAIRTSALPYAENATASTYLAVSLSFATIIPLFVNNSGLIPTSWGTFHPSVHEAHHAATSTFATAALISLAIHAASTIATLRSDPVLSLTNPPATAHTIHYTFPWQRRPSSTLTRSFPSFPRPRLAVPRLLAALSDHPTVRRVGWDVLLAGLTVCVWTAVRGLHTRDVLAAVWPSSSKGHAHSRRTTARQQKKGAKAPQHEHEEERGQADAKTATESVALVWGLLVVGGLGLGAASVYGAECVT